MPSEKAKGRGRGRKRKAPPTAAEHANGEERSCPPQQQDSPLDLTQSLKYVPRFGSKRARTSGLTTRGSARDSEESTEQAALEKPEIPQVSQLHPWQLAASQAVNRFIHNPTYRACKHCSYSHYAAYLQCTQSTQGQLIVGEGSNEELQPEELVVHDQEHGETRVNPQETHSVEEPPSPGDKVPDKEQEDNRMKAERLVVSSDGGGIPGLALSCSQVVAEPQPSHPQQRPPEGDENEAIHATRADSESPGEKLEMDRDDILLGMDVGDGVEEEHSLRVRPLVRYDCSGLGADEGDDVLMSPVSDGRNLELIDLLRDEEEEVREEEEGVEEGRQEKVGGEEGEIQNIGGFNSEGPAVLESVMLTPRDGGDSTNLLTQQLSWRSHPSNPLVLPIPLATEAAVEGGSNPSLPPVPLATEAAVEGGSQSPHHHTSPSSDAVLLGSQDQTYCPFKQADAPSEPFYGGSSKWKLPQTDNRAGIARGEPGSVPPPLSIARGEPGSVARGDPESVAPPLSIPRGKPESVAPPLSIARGKPESVAPPLSIPRGEPGSVAPPLSIPRGEPGSVVPPLSIVRGNPESVAPPPMEWKALTVAVLEEGGMDDEDFTAVTPDHQDTRSLRGIRIGSDLVQVSPPDPTPKPQEAKIRFHCEIVDELMDFTTADLLGSQLPNGRTDEAMVPSCSPALNM